MPRIAKHVQYEAEQRKILDKILCLINYSDNNRVFYLTDFQNDETKQNEIYALIPDIHKYYVSSNWKCLDIENNKDNPYCYKYINIIRAILIHNGYDVFRTQALKLVNNKYVRIPKYTVVKK